MTHHDARAFQGIICHAEQESESRSRAALVCLLHAVEQLPAGLLVAYRNGWTAAITDVGPWCAMSRRWTTVNPQAGDAGAPVACRRAVSGS